MGTGQCGSEKTQLWRRLEKDCMPVPGRLGLIAYTGAPKGDTSALVSAPDHKATEALVHESGLIRVRRFYGRPRTP